MTDCVGISKIAMGLCSGVLGICRSQVVASFVARIQYCSRGIEILFLAPFYRIGRCWHARACRLVPLVHVDAIGNTLCSSCCHGWLAIYTVLFSCAGSSSSSIYPGGLVQELL